MKQQSSPEQSSEQSWVRPSGASGFVKRQKPNGLLSSPEALSLPQALSSLRTIRERLQKPAWQKCLAQCRSDWFSPGMWVDIWLPAIVTVMVAFCLVQLGMLIYQAQIVGRLNDGEKLPAISAFAS